MNIRDMFSGEKGRRLLLIGAAAALILLLIGTLPRSGKSAAPAAEQTEDAAEIERSLEKRLEALISRIDGAGQVTVMVTLDRTSQKVYEKDEKTEMKSSDNTARETETVLAGSSKEPLRTGVVQPKVRGAAVVCSGAADPIIREKVTYTVAKALNIGISRVYVTC